MSNYNFLDFLENEEKRRNQLKEQPKPQKTFKQILDDTFGTVKETYNAMSAQEDTFDPNLRMHEIEEEMVNNKNLTDSEIENYKKEYLEASKLAAENQYNHLQSVENVKNSEGLGKDWLSDVAQGGGGSLGSAKRTLKYQVAPALALDATGVGAPLGDLYYRVSSPFVNAYNSFDDAKQAAIETKRKALERGATFEQASQIYKNALIDNIPFAMADWAIDTAIEAGGGQIGGAIKAGAKSVLKPVVNKIGKTAVGNVVENAGKKVLANNITKGFIKGAEKVYNFSPQSFAGKQVAKLTNSELAGKAVNVGVGMYIGGKKEGLQENQQGYTGDAEIEKVLNPTSSKGDILSLTNMYNYFTSPEAKEERRIAENSSYLFSGPQQIYVNYKGDTIGEGYGNQNAINYGQKIVDNLHKSKENSGEAKYSNRIKKDLYEEIKQDVAIAYDKDPEKLSEFDVSRMYVDLKKDQYLASAQGDRKKASLMAAADYINNVTGETQLRADTLGETASQILQGEDLSVFNQDLSTTLNQQQEATTQAQTDQTVENNENGVQYAQEQELFNENDNSDKFKERVKNIVKNQNQVNNNNTVNTQTQTQTVNTNGGSFKTPNIEQKGSYIENRLETGNPEPERVNPVPETIGSYQSVAEEVPSDNSRLFNINNRKIRVTKDEKGYTVTDESTPSRPGKILSNINEVSDFLNQIRGGTAELTKGVRFNRDGSVEITREALPKQDGDISEKDKQEGITTVHTHKDLVDFYNSVRGTKDEMSKRMFLAVSDAMRRYNVQGAGVDINLGLNVEKEGGSVYGDTNITYDAEGRVVKAVVSLYKGSDTHTAIHEIAHVGYNMLSDEQKTIMHRYAILTQGRMVANVLGIPYSLEL